MEGRRFCQSLASRPRSARASMSQARPRVATSASSPSMIERDWAPEPPWLCLMVTSWPVRFFQNSPKAGLIAL